MTLYPLGLRLAGRRVLVVGGGAVATRRVPALLDAGAEVVLVSPEITPALRSHVDAGRVLWAQRPFRPSDVDGCWLVQAAIDDPAAAAEITAAAEQRRVFCVRADDKDAATAWTPSVTRHGQVTAAVLGGGDPRLAAGVRDAIADGLADGTLLADADCLVVVAGLDASLATMIGALTDVPVVAVPTSTGQPSAFGGLGALLTMLNSGAPGVAVSNIDNGYSAGVFASRVARRAAQR